MPKPVGSKSVAPPAGYGDIRNGIVDLLSAARQPTARQVNALMTASYWEIGRRIVEAEQKGKRRAGYGEQLVERLSLDLSQQFGRGFSTRNSEQMRQFYLNWKIPQTLSAESSRLLLLSNSSTKRRQRLRNQTCHCKHLTSLSWRKPSSCHGQPTCACCQSKTAMPASSTKPKPCAAAEVCGNWTARSVASFTNDAPCQKTNNRLTYCGFK